MSDYVPVLVVDTSTSPSARLKPVPVSAVRLADGFWAPRLYINRDVTVPSQHRHLEKTGRLDNFRRAAGKLDQLFVGIYFKESSWQSRAAGIPFPCNVRLLGEVAGL